MSGPVNQRKNSVTNGDIVAGNKYVNEHPKSKLGSLFEKLNKEFNNDNKVSDVIEDLKRFTSQSDTIGLEQKLIDADREYFYERASWLKQEYSKKLTRFQFYEPAQEIHAFILGIILEKFTNLIYPLLRNKCEEKEVLKVISHEIIDPIVGLIQQEGAEDVMGLSSIEIQGMIYYLTGLCHIKWRL